jgi:hypothetical protein
MKKLLIVFSMFFFLLIVSSARADIINEIWTADVNGTSKRSFTTAETVYAAGNITSASTQIALCIVNATTTWTNGTRINETTGGCKLTTTNNTGYFLQTLWINPYVGSYDLIADVNKDGYYETDTDYVWNTTTVGFVVSAVTKPALTVALGSNTPSSHSCSASNMTECNSNVMIQVKFTADSYDDINITSISISANGTGDDKNSISHVRLIEDVNNTGKFAVGENIYASTKFLNDNGVLNLNFVGGYKINRSTSINFKIVYDFINGSADDTYMLRVESVSAIGMTTGLYPTITGLPLSSAVKTMTSATTSSTTTTSSTSATTTVAAGATTSTTQPATTNIFSDYIWLIALIVVVAGATVAAKFLLSKKKKEKPPETKKEEELSAEDLLKGI